MLNSIIWYYTPSLNIMSVCLCLVSYQCACEQCWSSQCCEHHQRLFPWLVKLNALHSPLRCTIIKCPRFPNKSHPCWGKTLTGRMSSIDRQGLPYLVVLHHWVNGPTGASSLQKHFQQYIICLFVLFLSEMFYV